VQRLYSDTRLFQFSFFPPGTLPLGRTIVSPPPVYSFFRSLPTAHFKKDFSSSAVRRIPFVPFPLPRWRRLRTPSLRFPFFTPGPRLSLIATSPSFSGFHSSRGNSEPEPLPSSRHTLSARPLSADAPESCSSAKKQPRRTWSDRVS